MTDTLSTRCRKILGQQIVDEFSLIFSRLLSVLFIVFSFGSRAQAGPVHLRAREHYEWTTMTTPNGVATFTGFTNTIDLWYEKPYQYLIGLAGSPIFATLSSKNPQSDMGERIRLVHLGLEGKLFPLQTTAAFGRLGVYHCTLISNGTAGRLEGISFLFALGYEIDWSGVGIAPEMSWRRGELNDHVSFTGKAPAVGVHFYKAI